MAAPLSAADRVAMLCLPMRPGEPCGDAAACHPADGPAGGCLLAIVDGLGHGAEAARAAAAALQLIAEQPRQALPDLLARLETGLGGTRGAAIGLVRVEGRRLLHAGIGNTRCLHWRGDRLARLSSAYGIVGGGLPLALEVTEIELQPGDWLLLFTDGIDERLQLPLRLPEWQRDPGLLCAHLMARWRTPRDDAGVLVWATGAE